MRADISIPEYIAVVVLDMDGTIYRKPRMALHMIGKQWRHLPSLIAERRWRKAQRQALKAGAPMPKMPVAEKWYKESYLPSMVKIIAKHYQPQEWVKPLIDTCKQRGVKLVILSDYEAVTDKLQVLGLDPADFDVILATGEEATVKPDPRLGDILLRKLYPSGKSNAAFDWRHVLFIGDREDTDGLLAKHLGAQFIKV